MKTTYFIWFIIAKSFEMKYNENISQLINCQY